MIAPVSISCVVIRCCLDLSLHVTVVTAEICAERQRLNGRYHPRQQYPWSGSHQRNDGSCDVLADASAFPMYINATPQPLLEATHPLLSVLSPITVACMGFCIAQRYDLFTCPCLNLTECSVSTPTDPITTSSTLNALCSISATTLLRKYMFTLTGCTSSDRA
jgi:hypothetical protein